MTGLRNYIRHTNQYISAEIEKFLIWRKQHISDRTFIIIVSIIIGIASGLAAAVLKSFVGYIDHFLNRGFQWEYRDYLFFIFPAVGILLTVLYVQRLQGGKLGRGISNILYTIVRKNSNVEKDKVYSHIITSGLTIGFGGSAGLEAPIVTTGSAIGSNIARKLKFDYQDKTALLAAGAAGGISAIFNSPIAGVLFAVEVLLREFSIPVIIPLLIASASASIVSRILYSEQLFYLITSDWKMEALPWYVLLGIIAGLLSVYVIRMSLRVEKMFMPKGRVYLKAIAGGLILGTFIFFLPPLYGEGYSTVESLLKNHYRELSDRSLYTEFRNNAWFNLVFAAVIVLVKVFATSVTVGAGGNGGIFAPSLFMGALTGYVFSHSLKLAGITDLNEANFIVAGMAGALSGILHAPLTAIFLIAEITGGYLLFVPLMIVSAGSYFISRYFEPWSIYTKQLAGKGRLLADKDKYILSSITVRDILEKDFMPLSPENKLGELVEKFSSSGKNIFPVLSPDGKLEGVIVADNIRAVLFNQNLYAETTVRDLMTQPPTILDIHSTMLAAMKKMDDEDVWYLPVSQNGIFAGFVSKSSLFTLYRKALKKERGEV
ncbi:MAG: chloride channel protein [Bacteroidetes bacterium]|nr:chloride channel protein [Bacteroidota bacterium]